MVKTKWTEEAIEKGIFEVMEKAEIKTMPTSSLITQITGRYSLSVAIQKHGGFAFWASKLGLEMSNCETRVGQSFENICINDLIKFGYDCESTNARYPYDILADFVKIDVKVSNLYNGKTGDFYTFNLEKSKPTCDIFVAYCIDERKDIKKVYVIPAVVLQGKTQLSIGKTSSKYDKYLTAWDIVKKYNDFYRSIADEQQTFRHSL